MGRKVVFTGIGTTFLCLMSQTRIQLKKRYTFHMMWKRKQQFSMGFKPLFNTLKDKHTNAEPFKQLRPCESLSCCLYSYSKCVFIVCCNAVALLTGVTDVSITYLPQVNATHCTSSSSPCSTAMQQLAHRRKYDHCNLPQRNFSRL